MSRRAQHVDFTFRNRPKEGDSLSALDMSHEDSLSQPQPDSASARPFLLCLFLLFYVCFSSAVSLIKTIINSCYWQSDWILFGS